MKSVLVFLVCGWLRLYAGMLTLWDASPFAADLKKLDETQLWIQPAWSPDSIALPLASLREWVDPAWVETPAASVPDVRLVFRHGDELSGRLLSMDGDWVRVTSVWGQDIGVRRNMLSYLEVLPAEKDVILNRPGPTVEWNSFSRSSLGDIREVGRALQFSPSVGGSYNRTLPVLPQRFRLDLRIRPLGKEPMYSLQVTPTLRNSMGFGGFLLQFHQDILRINTYGSMMQPGSDMRIPSPKTPTGVQNITLFGDLADGKYQLWMNDKRVHSWSGARLADGEFPVPYQLNLRANDRDFYLIEGFRLTRWESAPLQEEAYAPLAKQHRVLFRNADSFVGQVMGFEEGRFLLSGEDGFTLRVPMVSVDRLTFPSEGGRKPRRNSRDVLVMLGATQDRLTLQLTGLDETQLVGKSECFDVPILLPKSAMAYLRFNLYQSGSRKLAVLSAVSMPSEGFPSSKRSATHEPAL